MLQQIQAEQKEQKAHTKMLETQLAQLAEQTSKEARGAPKAPQGSSVHQVNKIELGPEESGDELVGMIDDEKEPEFEQKTLSKDVVSSDLKERFAEFCEVVQELHTKMPLLEEILAEKKKVNENLTQVSCQARAVIEKSLPVNQGDPGSFCIPVIIRGLGTIGALADLGASVNLMPLSVAMRLDTPLLPSEKAIRLVDGSVHYLSGELEGVPVRIGNAYVSCNFVVMDVKEDPRAPLIFGREALRAMGAIIDCKANAISLEVGEEKIVFDFGNGLGELMVERVYMMSFVNDGDGSGNGKLACTPKESVLELIGGDKHEAKMIPRLPPEKPLGLASEAKSLEPPVHVEKCANGEGTGVTSIDLEGVSCGARSPKKKKKRGKKRGVANFKGLGANPNGKSVQPPLARDEDDLWESNRLHEVAKACLTPAPPTAEFEDALKRR